MADHRERKIPVFSVWKNDAILKNIFLINAPPSLNEIEDEEIENWKTQKEFEETLMIGRHPDCDIRLEHPSISRFHLRIHSIPSSTHLSITDLSSVHGTWVSGKRIEPNVRTKLNEGDALRLGGSSRVYKLHWIPFSQAYDMEHPFVPPLDFPEPNEDEEEEIIKDENCPGSENEIVNLVNSVSKSLESVVLCEHDEVVAEKVVTEEPSLQEEITLEVRNADVELVSPYLEGLESLFADENSDVCDREEIPPAAQMQNGNSEVSVNKNYGSVSLFLDENSEMSVQKEIQMQNERSKVLQNVGSRLEYLFQDENCEVFVLKETPPSAHQMQSEDTDVCVNKNSDSESLFHDENSESSVQKDIEMQNENSEVLESDDSCLESSFEDENSEVCVLKGIPQDPQMQYEHSEILEIDNQQVVDVAVDGLVPLFMGENWEWIGQENHLECPTIAYNPLPFTNEDESFVNSVLDGVDHPFLDKTSNRLLHEYIPSAPPMPENMAFDLAPNLDSSLADENELSAEMIIENEKHEEDNQDVSWKFWYGSHIVPSSPPANVLPETENHNIHKENQCPQFESESPEESEDRELWSFWSGNMGVESLCSSFSDAEAFFSESENRSLRNIYQSPELLSSGKKQFGSPLLTSARNSACSIWSRRGKQESAPQILTSRTKGKKVKTDQENVKDEKSISRALFDGVDDDQEEEEIFTPDKENFTPNTHRSMRKLAVLKEAKCSNSGKSSPLKITVSPDTSPASDKENYSSQVLQERKTVRRGSVNQVRPLRPLQLKERIGARVPFQTLLSESPQNSISETCFSDSTVRSGKSVKCAKSTSKTLLQEKCTRERTQKWNMVVDTTTLLNKGSRKALQLLAGLRGTQLIIPRIVIRELDSLKRQTSFFRRNSEVLSALDWIQDCMAENQWWVHVQGSMEEGRPVAPTPPASPLSHFSCGTPFSAFGSRAELLSPTPDDHVLDYALCFRKARNDGQLVLLSDDITLKIKAIAEGIICERAEEFRETLVNPFSERFLWADSSPRGQTWTCSDDIVLKEKFYPSSLKMTPKSMENVKGLKLILLHNSQYFERMTGLH